jgi:hypothetical protein
MRLMPARDLRLKAIEMLIYSHRFYGTLQPFYHS